MIINSHYFTNNYLFNILLLSEMTLIYFKIQIITSVFFIKKMIKSNLFNCHCIQMSRTQLSNMSSYLIKWFQYSTLADITHRTIEISKKHFIHIRNKCHFNFVSVIRLRRTNTILLPSSIRWLSIAFNSNKSLYFIGDVLTFAFEFVTLRLPVFPWNFYSTKKRQKFIKRLLKKRRSHSPGVRVPRETTV